MAQLQKGWHSAGGTAAGSGTAGFGSVERARGVTARPRPRSTAPWLFPEGFGCPGLCWPLFLGLLLSLFGVEMAGMLFAAGAAGCGCTAHGVPHVMCTGISTPLGTGTHLEVVAFQKPLPFEFRVTEGTSWSRKPPGLSRLPLQASSPNHIPERGVSLPAGDVKSSPPRLHPPMGWEVGVVPPCPWLSPELTSPLFLPAAPADRRQFLRAGF